MTTRGISPAVWLWCGQDARSVLATRDLGQILKMYRTLTGTRQEELAEALGYHKTYLSMIENQRRKISDVATRRHFAHVLGLPAHVLGVTDSTDADHAAMLQFGDSTIRLAEIARQSGRAVDAVNELWLLTARLEARATEGRLDRDTLIMLGQARLALGVSLGTVLPEERLSVAARWTGKALLVARQLEDRAFMARTLQMHGNELRKADHSSAAIVRLAQAVNASINPIERGSALALLARATGEAGLAEVFDRVISEYRDLVEKHGSGDSILFNPFTFCEIHLRGLIMSGRITEAARRVQDSPSHCNPPAPQWRVIERITVGHAMSATEDLRGAQDTLIEALAASRTYRLPHQIQRIVRIARGASLDGVADEAASALTGVRASLALPEA